jgi:hypothetical protein
MIFAGLLSKVEIEIRLADLFFWLVVGCLGFSLLLQLLLPPSSPLHLVVYAPAMFYRFALKVTALTYFPLLLNRYIAASSVPIEQQYKELRDNKRTTITLRIAFFIVIGVLLKIVACSFGLHGVSISNQFVHDFSQWLATIPILGRRITITIPILGSTITIFGRLTDPSSVRNYLTIQLTSYSIPLWQLASALNGLLTLAFHYFGVEYFYWRMDRNDPVDHSLMRGLLNAMLTISGIISTYSILANIWIVTHRTPLLILPRIGEVWP